MNGVGWHGLGAAVAMFALYVYPSVSSPAASDPTSLPTTQTGSASTQVPSRADLADAYLRLERAFFAEPPTGERLVEVNRAFDRASLSFFGGDFGRSIALLDQLTETLPGHAAGVHRVFPTPSTTPAGLDGKREANAAKLAGIQADSPALRQALAACRARNALLTDRPSAGSSSQFMQDMGALADAVAHEMGELAAGRDPYRGRVGGLWRVVLVGEMELPVRIHAPPAVREDRPIPLIIALHGAGGDESMFIHGYGAGLLPRLADERGFLLAAPLTPTFATHPACFDKLVEALSLTYAIDRDRVYVIGHSMGSAAAGSLAVSRADKIAAVCTIAGRGRFDPAKPLAPTLVIAAELDMLIPAQATRTAALESKEAGLPVEFRLIPNYGHTLVVGAVLPDVVDWLLARRLAATSRPALVGAAVLPTKVVEMGVIPSTPCGSIRESCIMQPKSHWSQIMRVACQRRRAMCSFTLW